MAKAIARGLSHNNTLRLMASSPSLPDAVSPEGIVTHYDNITVARQADVVILAVKPSIARDVAKDILPHLEQHAILVSVVAGTAIARLSPSSAKQAIIRAMPNLPLAIGKGATALFANQYTSEQQKALVESLFQYSGITTWLKEEHEMNALTALSGSGPGYLFFFLEAIMQAAKKLGIDEPLATSFTLQTMSGSLAMLEATGLSAEALRKKTSSPAGTTAAAIAILEQQGFAASIADAMQAACQRAGQLGEQ